MQQKSDMGTERCSKLGCVRTSLLSQHHSQCYNRFALQLFPVLNRCLLSGLIQQPHRSKLPVENLKLPILHWWTVKKKRFSSQLNMMIMIIKLHVASFHHLLFLPCVIAKRIYIFFFTLVTQKTLEIFHRIMLIDRKSQYGGEDTNRQTPTHEVNFLFIFNFFN